MQKDMQFVKWLYHTKLYKWRTELQIMVVALFDKALSPLYSHLNSLLVKKACFPLEIIHWNHTCQYSNNFQLAF